MRINDKKLIIDALRYFSIIALISAIITDVKMFMIFPVILLTVSVILSSRFYGYKKIKVKYFVPDLPPLKKLSVGDWIDLRAGETVFFKAGEYYPIRLGVGMILPKGYEAVVLPRSSTPNAFGIVCANSAGLIDNSYCGDGDEWRFPAVALRDTIIHKGDRIAQFRIVENQPEIIIKTVGRLKTTDRGGLGSTGKR